MESEPGTWRRLFSTPSFTPLWVSRVMSAVGDAFTTVCLPLLLLDLSNDSMALASALAVNALPRIVLVLVGGAVADLMSPLKMLRIASLCYGLLGFTLAGLLATEAIEIWMLFVSAFVSGWLGALSAPAGPVILTRVVERESLAAANSLMLGSTQVVESASPAVVGAVVALLVSLTSNLDAYALAFFIDASTFIFALVVLNRVDDTQPSAATSMAPSQLIRSVLSSTIDGVRYATRQAPIRALLMFAALSELATLGCTLAGIPLIANPSESPASMLGLLLSTFSVGAIAGTSLSAAIARLEVGTWRLVLMGTSALRAMVLVALGLSFSYFGAVVVGIFLTGVVRGLNRIVAMTLIQRIAPPEAMGRVFSIFASVSALVVPFALMGFSFLERQVGLPTTFVIAGFAALSVVVLLLGVKPFSDAVAVPHLEPPRG